VNSLRYDGRKYQAVHDQMRHAAFFQIQSESVGRFPSCSSFCVFSTLFVRSILSFVKALVIAYDAARERGSLLAPSRPGDIISCVTRNPCTFESLSLLICVLCFRA